jgi:hypothetical protein
MSQLRKSSSTVSHFRILQNQALAAAIRAGLELRADNSRDSIDHFDARAMSGRLGKRTVTGDHRRLDRFGERYLHRVVCADVVAQFPRTTQQIEVGVTVEIEVSEIGNGFVGTASRDLTASHETSEALSDLDVHESGACSSSCA